MKITELQTRVRQIHSLLSNPEPGLYSWNVAVANKLNELTTLWQEDTREERNVTHVRD